MSNALGMAGDVSSASAALAGLLLVFMGSIATAFDGYHKQEQRVVLSRFRLRIWFAFIGFFLAIAATFLSLLANWLKLECAAIGAIILLFISLGWAIAAAIRAALDVK